MAVVLVWEKHFFIYKLISLLARVITAHKISTIYFVNYAAINVIHIFILVVIRATDISLLWPVTAVNPLQQRKRAREKKPASNSLAKHRLKNINNIAKINQNNGDATKEQNLSASHTKITHDSSSSESDISSDEENTDSPKYWIIDVLNIVAAFQKACVCRKCHGNVKLLEIESCRAGLGTKFSIWCVNSQCSMNESFYSTNKTNRVFDVNKKSVLASRIISKEHTGLSKFCSILGLSSPIVKSQFVKHVKYLEEKVFESRDENLKIAATRARNLIIKENNLDPSVEIVDIPTSFDGT